jgi:hypothetical protein
LGYGPVTIAHAFSALTGPGTVDEALIELKENARLEGMTPAPLDFEVVEREPALPVGYALSISGVQRDGRGIHITYEIRPPLCRRADPPRVEARDDSGREYRGVGGSIGVTRSQHHTKTIGSFTAPLPQRHSSLLRVRMSWSRDATSVWKGPAQEVRILL